MVSITKAIVKNFFNTNRNEIVDVIILQQFLYNAKVKAHIIERYDNVDSDNYEQKVAELINSMINDLLTV